MRNLLNLTRLLAALGLAGTVAVIALAMPAWAAPARGTSAWHTAHPAAATLAPPTPAATPSAPAVAAPAAPAFVATSPVLAFGTGGTATATVSVQNPGPALCPGRMRLVVLPGRTTDSAPGELINGRPGGRQPCLRPGNSVITATFSQRFHRWMTGAVLSFPGDPAIQPVVVTFRRSVGWRDALGFPVLAGAAFAFFWVLATVLWLLCTGGIPGTIHASSSWNFKDSWATNITTAGAVLASVLAATGAASTLLPGVPTDQFSLLSVAWGVMLLVAPLLFAFQPLPAGNGQAAQGDQAHAAQDGHGQAPQGGVQAPSVTLFVTAFLTLFGVGGELATVAVLTRLSAAPGPARAWVYGGLGLLVMVTGLYAAFTTRTLVRTQNHPAGIRSGLNGPGHTSMVL